MNKPRSKKEKLAPKSKVIPTTPVPRTLRTLEDKELEGITGGVINEYDA